MLTDEIMAAVKKNLPGEVGEALKQALQEAADNKRMIVRLEDNIKGFKEDQKRTSEQLEEFRANEKFVNERIIKIKEAEDRLRQIDVEAMKLNVEYSKMLNQEMLHVLGMVFRNTEVRHEFMKNIPLPIQPGAGYSGCLQTGQETGSVTKSKE